MLYRTANLEILANLQEKLIAEEVLGKVVFKMDSKVDIFLKNYSSI